MHDHLIWSTWVDYPMVVRDEWLPENEIEVGAGPTGGNLVWAKKRVNQCRSIVVA